METRENEKKNQMKEKLSMKLKSRNEEQALQTNLICA